MRISLTLLFVAAWNICCLPLGCAKYSIPELDDEFQESIAELISNDAESSLDTISQVIQFKKVLKQLIGMPDTSVSDNIKDSVQQTDISMEGNTVIEEAIKIPCHKHFGCADCVSNLCAWCIAQRVCKDDAAWQCLGQHDHVGLGGIGNHMKCPSLESMNQQRQARRKRKEEAKKETALNLIQKPIINTSKTSSVNADNNNRESTQQQSQEEKLIELKRRATLAEDNYGATHPYETLGVDLTASGGEIRKIYRKLSLLYHPDKNQGDEEVTSLADAAFKDIVAAFDILGDPDKRSYFDEGTSQEAFNTFDDYMRYGQRNENNFYQGNKLITALTESMWERRVGSGNTVWLVEYYAPWCGHCQQMVPTFSNIASMLEEEEAIEVGAVNCATQSVICNEWFGIRSYPTVVALNDHHGMRQEYDGPLEPLEVTTWLKRVAREWRWLMRQSRHLISLVSEQAFKEQVLESNEFWIVVFLDGFDCSACQTAKTNVMRLAASLKGLSDVKVGIVNCEEPESDALCYDNQQLPGRPHAPVAKAYPMGNKSSKPLGEVLYNSNEVEPHIALELLEKTVRLTLADRVSNSTLVEAGDLSSDGTYEKDRPEREEEERPPAEPLWNGPKRRDPLPWGGGGGAPIDRARLN